MEQMDISLEKISLLINNLEMSSSCGVDRKNSKMLRNAVTVSSEIFLHIFKQSLAKGLLPTDQKIAKIIRVFKNGNKSSNKNYRPISFTCISCKLLEHIIASQIYRHLETTNFFFYNQHGFRKGLSCETVAWIYDRLTHKLEQEPINWLFFSWLFQGVRPHHTLPLYFNTRKCRRRSWDLIPWPADKQPSTLTPRPPQQSETLS